tara:strand:+ start:723 stop:989 length:267 start_codon:yes stop_codon:yes gene_type:complete
MVIAGNHNISDTNTTMVNAPRLFDKDKGIVIKNDVWIRDKAVIFDGPYVSEGTVISAEALLCVKPSLIPYTVVYLQISSNIDLPRMKY